MKRVVIIALIAAVLLNLSGCRSYSSVDIGAEAPVEPETFSFVAAYGGTYTAVLDPEMEKHSYDLSCFKHYGDILAYTGDQRYYYRLGIDVSYYQGDIDWKAVRDAGFEFAFIRIGFRGYGSAGTLNPDENFRRNIEGAKAAGLDVGVYFFAQAVDEEEAVEEAEYVLEMLAGEELDLPVVYDPETIYGSDARTDDVSGEQFTANTIAFCETIEDAGYTAMVYCNMLWEAFTLDLKQLDDYLIWYADYEPVPQTPYRFEYWQYTAEGAVDGIKGDVDINIQLIPFE